VRYAFCSVVPQVSPAQVILRWAVQRGLSVVPKSSKPERLALNLAVAYDGTEDRTATATHADVDGEFGRGAVIVIVMSGICIVLYMTVQF